jgi:hypothetical protein
MQQVVSVLVVGCLVVGAFIGMKVGRARSSHGYYRRAKESMPVLRKTAWTEIRSAAGIVLLVAILVAVFVYGITTQG